MAGDPEGDFPTSFAILAAGTLTPALVVAVAPEPAALPVSGRGVVLVVAAAFGLASWLLIERLGLDHVDFLTASFVTPWLVLLAGTFLVLFLNRGEQIPRGPAADVFRFLIGPTADFFVYGAAFVLAGTVAVGLSKRSSGRSRSASE